MNRPFSSNVCPKCGVSLPSDVASVCPLCLIDSTESHAGLFGSQQLQLPYQLGNYRLLSKLGEGGMGVVFEAEHTGSGRRLALKILKEFVGDERERQRFLREGELASTIDHPHSVYVFGTEEIDGLLVISMELAPAGTLREEVARRGPLPIREAVDRILEVLSALEVAHSKGVLHRDIKPSNCFLDAEHRTLLGDYGLSISPLRHAASEPLTQSGAFIGTPSYCAPEQIRGMALDPRADFYSLAGTLYFLLSGKSPVEAYTPIEAIAAALEGRIPSIRELRPDVPKDLAAVLTCALSPSPENRFQDHAAFRQALLPWSSQAPTPAPLGVRFLAGLTDFALLGLGFFIARGFLAAAQEPSTSLSSGWTDGLIAALLLSLWILLECLSGASPGKWLLGLRLEMPGGGKAPASKGLLRTALFAGILAGVFLLWIGFWRLIPGDLNSRDFQNGLVHWVHSNLSPDWLFRLVILDFVIDSLLLLSAPPFSHLVSALPLFYLVLFRRVGRYPQYAALHDRLSGIRVVLRSPSPPREAVPETLDSLRLDWSSFSETWGPIQVGPVLENGLRVGIDPVLHRRVFLEKQAAAAPEARRWCERASRLRWLQSVRDGEGTLWEVWQAPSGSPLCIRLAAAPVPWSMMLDWMRQIAREIREAAKEGTLPKSLSLEHVWITADHRALLLDSPWQRPGTAADAPLSSQSPSAIQACCHLLWQMSRTCPHWGRPLHSDSLLTSLENASIERFTHLLGLLNALWKKKPALSQNMRECVTILPFLLAPIFLLLSSHWNHQANEARWAQVFPSLPPLPRVLTEMAFFHPPLDEKRPDANARLDIEINHGTGTLGPLLLFFGDVGHGLWFHFRQFGPPGPTSTALSTHLRGHYPTLFNTDGNLRDANLQLPEIDKKTIRALLDRSSNLPPPDGESLAEADRRIAKFLEHIPRLGGIPLGWGTCEQLFDINQVLGSWIPLVAIFQCVSILVLGSPALMRLAGAACVSLRYRPAGRPRMLARWALVWIPAWGIQMAFHHHALSILRANSPFDLGSETSVFPSLIGATLLPLLIACTSLFPRNRCLLDRLTGIWKVQR